MKDKGVILEDQWIFDSNVADCFDDMLKRSIPQYDIMRDLVFNLGKQFQKDNTCIVDIGCSRGRALEPFVNEFKSANQYRGIEVSEPMLEASRKLFKENKNVIIHNMDLKTSMIDVESCIVLSVLTIQFVPIEYRQEIIQKIYDLLIPGVAFIFVEKILGKNAEIDKLLVDEYYNIKRNNGYSQDEILRKKLALEGVLVPVTAKWNEDLLSSAGFKKIDCFWRYLNFAGWVAIK